jgi:ribokinase
VEHPGTVAVLGSANLDIVVPVPHHPVTGETVMGGDHALVPGGKGANQAVAAARLGATVYFVGRVGSDDAGTTLRGSLEAAGVDTTFLRSDKGAPSGIALIGVDAAGDNAIVVSPGANGRVGPDDVSAAETVIRDATVLLVQLEVPMEAVVAAARVATGTVILNPAPASPLSDDLLALVDVLVPNSIELAQLVGAEPTSDVDEVVAQARSLPVERVVVTMGAAGALLVTPDGHLLVPAPTIQPVDTTGAGDSFCGAMAEALARGVELGTAVERAVHAGAVTATRPGAQPAMPSTVDLEASMAGLAGTL